MSDVCCFCLGGTADIPAFGTREDARDFVHPCATCSIVAHRKCLLDWFNSLPDDKLQVIEREDLLDTIAGRRRIEDDPNDGNIRIDINLSTALIREWLYRFVGRGEEPRDETDIEEELHHVIGDDALTSEGTNANGSPNTDNTNEDTNETTVNAGNVNDSNTTDYTNTNNTPTIHAAVATPNLDGLAGSALALLHQHDQGGASSSENVTFLLAPCPQCKSDIVVSMTESAFLTFVKSTKTMAIRTLSAAALCLGVTSAVTGVVSLGYVGLTTCGLKTMEALVPGRVLVSMLQRPGAATFSPRSYSGPLESAISSGIIDPFKFLRIPILPIVLYRMRSSSVLSLLAQDSNWFTEVVVAAYFSSLGNNELAAKAGAMLQTAISQRLAAGLVAAAKTWSLASLTAPTLISLLVPLRWAYHLFFRLTFNRLHFNVALKTRPREIANSISDARLERLEDLSREMAQQWDRASKMRPKSRALGDWTTFMKRLVGSDIPRKYLSLWLSFWLEETRACLQHDYLSVFLLKSLMLRAITTVAWPFVGARIGRVIFKIIASRLASRLPVDIIMLVANIMGLVTVVVLKDTFNLYVATQKARQLRDMGWVAWNR